MKDHEVREFVDRLTATALKHAGCDSLRAAISKEVKGTLDSHKEPTGCDCQGWGCMKCCSSEAEIRARQGTFG